MRFIRTVVIIIIIITLHNDILHFFSNLFYHHAITTTIELILARLWPTIKHHYSDCISFWHLRWDFMLLRCYLKVLWPYVANLSLHFSFLNKSNLPHVWKLYLSNRQFLHFCRAHRGGGRLRDPNCVRPSVTLTKTWITLQPQARLRPNLVGTYSLRTSVI